MSHYPNFRLQPSTPTLPWGAFGKKSIWPIPLF
jgi:hypothetical protein